MGRGVYCSNDMAARYYQCLEKMFGCTRSCSSIIWGVAGVGVGERFYMHGYNVVRCTIETYTAGATAAVHPAQVTTPY